MNDSSGPRDAAIERRLERLSMAGAPPAARHRVLMAVDDVLGERAAALDRAALAEAPDWKWSAAVAIGIALVVPLVASWLPARRHEPLTFARRLRAAGLADDREWAALAAAAPRDRVVAPARPDAPATPSRPTVRRLDIDRLLEEIL